MKELESAPPPKVEISKEKITYVEDLERVKALEDKINIILTELEQLNMTLQYKNKEIQDL